MPHLSELYGRARPIMGGQSTCAASPSSTYRPACGLPRGVLSSFRAFGHCSALGRVRPGRPKCARALDVPEPGEPRLGSGPASARSELRPPGSPRKPPWNFRLVTVQRTSGLLKGPPGCSKDLRAVQKTPGCSEDLQAVQKTSGGSKDFGLSQMTS
eukprot:2380059-Alexandrium_andersonii.AAC.2